MQTDPHSTVRHLSHNTALPRSSCSRWFRLGMFIVAMWLATSGPSSKSAQAQESLLDQPLRHLFVPLEEFDAVMARDREGTLLKRTEFEALVAKALKHRSPETRPTGLVISTSNYVARIDGDQLLLTATVQFTHFEKSWTEFHIPTDGLSVEKCQINGQPALAGWHGENPNILRVFTDVQGAGTLTLELSARLAAVGSDQATAFGVVPAASGELVVSLPAGKFLLSEGSTLARTGAADQPAEYRVSIGGRSQVSLQITNRQTSTRTDSLTLANTAIAVTVAPGEVAWSAKAALQVVGRPVDRVLCTVPQSLEITAVESTGLDSWQLAAIPDDPAHTLITLAYRQPFDGSREIQFRGILKAATDMAWDVPTLDFRDITSQVGIAEVRYPPGVRLRVGELDGVRSVVSQAVRAENGDSLLHFQIWKPQFKLPFVTEPKTREVRAAVTNLLDLNSAGLDFTSVINLQTRLAPLFDAQINLPASWQIRSIFLGDQPISWQVVPQEASINQIRITFPTPIPAEGTVTLTVNAGLEPEKWPVEDTSLQVALPRIQLPQASVIEGLYGITAEAALDVVPSELAGLDPPNPAELELLRQKIAAMGRLVRLGFSLQDSEYKGQLAVTRKPARLSSQESTFFRIEPDALHSHIETQLKVEGGGVRQLLIDLPEASGTDLRFILSPFYIVAPNQIVNDGQQGGRQGIRVTIPPQIVEQTAAPAKNGLRRWTLRLDRYAYDTNLLSVDIRYPRPEKGPFNCPVFTVVGAERETGFVAIEASQEQFLSPLATDVSGQPLLKVDPIDFPASSYAPKETIVAGFRYTRPGWTLAVSEQRFDRSQVPTAVGHHATYHSVLGRNGELQHQADLEFTAVGVQNLKVRLPAEVSLWAVQMNGSPQEIRKQADGLLVAVPQNGSTNTHHTLTLFYRSRLASAASEDFRQVPPAFTVLDGQGTEQPLQILKQSWNLSHPNNLRLIHSPGAFQPTADLDQDGWLGRWSSLLRAPSPVQIRDTILLVAIMGLVVWGLRNTVERFGWLRSVCGLAVLVLAAAVLWPSIQEGQMASSSTEGHPLSNVIADMATVNAPVPAAPKSAPAMDDMVRGNMGGGFGGGERFHDGEFSKPSMTPEALFRNRAQEERKESKDQIAGADKPVRYDPNAAGLGGMPGMSGSGLAPFGAIDGSPNTEGDTFNGVLDAPQTASPQSGAGEAPPFAPPQAAPSAPNNAAYEDTEKVTSPQAKLGGLLSLALALATPDDSTQREFTFLGNGSAATDLHLKFISRDKSRDWTAFVLATVVVAGWFLRRLSLGTRTALVALLILGSIAIAPLLPARCQPIVDGLFFGGWALLIQFLVCRTLCCIKSRCCPGSSTCPATPLTSAVVVLALCLAPTLVSAQEDAAKKPAPPRFSPHVVLPYSGDDPSTADRVYIPQKLYLELWKKAHPDTGIPAEVPFDGLVVEALHAATFEQTGDSAVIHVKSRMVVINLRDSQVALTLPIREVALNHATINGQSAVLQTDGAGYKVVLAQRGPHVLDVEFDLPATVEGAAGRFTLKVLATAAARLSVQLPKIMGDRDLRVNGATGAYRIRDAETGPVLDTAVDRGGDITISWQPRAIRGAGNTIVHVDTGESIVVDDTGLQVNHHFSYRVRQGALTEVTFETTPTMAIREISGPDVGGWQLDDAQGTSRRLRVFLRRTVEDQTLILIDQFTPLEVTDQVQTLPVMELVPMDATREIGQIGLFAGGEFTLRASDVKGAAQIDVAKYQPVAMPHRPEAAPQAAYRFATRPASLSLSVSRKQPETKCLVEHGVLIGTRKLEWASRFVFDLSGAPRPSVSVDLPPGFLLMDVEGSEFISDWYDSGAENGHRTLTIEFDQPRLGQAEILIHGLVARQDGNTSVELLAPQSIGVVRVNTSLAVWLNDIYSATIKSSEGWKTAAPEQLSPELQHLRPTPVQFAFRTNAPVNQPVLIDLTRQMAQLSADLVILTAVADDSVDYGLTFRWKITRAAADTFQFTTPEWLKGRLELNVPGVRQISSEATETGEILWTIQLIDAVRDQFLCTGVVTLPPPSDDVIQIPDVLFLDTIMAGKQTPLETQRRCAIVVNRSAGQLVAIDERLINKLPSDQLPLVVDHNLLQQALAITELSGQQALPKWKLVRTAVQDNGRATVTGSDLATAVAWDGAWKTQAVYTVRNRGQQFLGLRLPENSQLLSVFVKGRPSRTVTTRLNEKTVHLIPLPQTSVVDLSFDVRITLGGQLAQPLESDSHLASQEISLPAPDVVSREESPDFGLTVAHTSWRIFTPDQLDVTLVEDRQKSNVDQLSDDQLFASLEIQKSSRMEADAKELIRIINDTRSDNTRKSQSMANLKQLQQSLALQCATIESNAPAKPEAVQLYDEAKSFNGRLLDEVTRNTLEIPAEQRSQVQATIDNNRDFIEGNNNLNFTNNNGDGLSIVNGPVESFQFKGAQLADKKMDQAAKGKQSGGRGALRKSLESQSYSNSVQGGQQRGSFSSRSIMLGSELERQNEVRLQTRVYDVSEFASGQWKEAPRYSQPMVAGRSMWSRETSAGLPANTTWTQTGGLSLPIEIPTVGTETVFSKVGGSPTLTLALRPRKALTSSLTWLWSLCWGLLAVWIARRVQRASSAASLRPVLGFLAVLGVLGYLLLDGSLGQAGLIVFIVSLLASMLVGIKRIEA